MIRLEIITDHKAASDDLAHLLAFEERIEIVDFDAAPPDVLLAVKLPVGRLPRRDLPVVGLSEDGGMPPAGVHAWLPLHSRPGAIVAAIVAAAAGLYTLTSDQVHLSSSHNIGPELVEKLTIRELQVLNLMAEGLGNKQIAAHLKISGHTSKFHVAQVLAKFRAGTRTEAVRIGIRRGLVAL